MCYWSLPSCPMGEYLGDFMSLFCKLGNRSPIPAYPISLRLHAFAVNELRFFRLNYSALGVWVKADKILERAKKFRPDWLTLVLVGLIVYLWFRPPASVSDENRLAPVIQASLLDGRKVSLEQLRGKVVLINFWATWCPYCRHEIPDMAEFYRDYQTQGFEILALSQDDSPEVVRQFLAKEGILFPVAMAEASHANDFGGVSKLPTSFLIDRQGRIRKKISGQVHYARLEDLVKPLLVEKSSP